MGKEELLLVISNNLNVTIYIMILFYILIDFVSILITYFYFKKTVDCSAKSCKPLVRNLDITQKVIIGLYTTFLFCILIMPLVLYMSPDRLPMWFYRLLFVSLFSVYVTRLYQFVNFLRFYYTPDCQCTDKLFADYVLSTSALSLLSHVIIVILYAVQYIKS